MTYLNFLAEPGNNACEFVAEKLDFLGIWGEFDVEVVEEVVEISWFDLYWWKDWLVSLWAPDQLYFKLVVHILIGFCCFLLGLLTRRSRISDLLAENSQERTKSSQLMQQLWSSMEENLAHKGNNEKTKLHINDLKRDLQLALSEKDAITTKNWGLERNMKIIQAERDALDGKIKNLLSFSEVCAKKEHSINGSFGYDSGKGAATNDDLRSMTMKFQELQKLVKSLLQTHRHEQSKLVEALSNASGV